MFETLLYEVTDHVATITLNRPDQLNAYTSQMARDLVAAFDRTDADDEVRVVIVTGAGRAFCAGADLSAGGATFDFMSSEGRHGPVRADGSIDWSHKMIRDDGGLASLRIYQSLKPVIGAINGPAVGIGITLTLPMDVRMAVEHAKIGFVFNRRGIVPEAASSFFLPRVVGISRALEWCATGRIFLASDPEAAPLFRSLHASDDLLPAARALAREMTQSAPVSVALSRKMMWRGLSMTEPMEAHRVDSRGVFFRGRSADAQEGVASFLEKRDPVWRDRVSKDMPEWYPWWTEAEWG